LKLSNICFLTTIFPMKEKFLIDFFDSLSRQTYNNFDVVVVNDGYDNFSDVKIKYQNLSIIELAYSNTPAKNREYGINYCIENNYDILIFGDSDDYFSNNRIAKSISLLSSYDIVVNDLSTFNNTGILHDNYLSNRVQNNSIVNYNFIKDKNIFGLTNTAINLNILNKVKFDELLIAVDWFMFKGLLKLGFKAIFTNEIISYYRQHLDNTIGLREVGGIYPLWWEKDSGYEAN
jgi:glycosyltransferase involved in cell wall biosynthesis